MRIVGDNSRLDGVGDVADAVRNLGKIRLTTARRRVLELLLGTQGPVKAYELVANFHADGRKAAPTTVYRALDFLLSKGIIDRIPSLNAFILNGPDRQAGLNTFVICDACHTLVQTMPGPRLGDVSLGLDPLFAARNATIELHGICSSCAKRG